VVNRRLVEWQRIVRIIPHNYLFTILLYYFIYYKYKIKLKKKRHEEKINSSSKDGPHNNILSVLRELVSVKVRVITAAVTWFINSLTKKYTAHFQLLVEVCEFWRCGQGLRWKDAMRCSLWFVEHSVHFISVVLKYILGFFGKYSNRSATLRCSCTRWRSSD